MMDTVPQSALARRRGRRVVSPGLEAGCRCWLLVVAGVCLPLLGNSYLGVIATRACIYWVLVSGLNLVVGFAGQIAIGWVALLTLGAYATSVLTAGTVMPEMSPYLALADRRRCSARSSASSSACRRSGCAPSISP